LEVLLKVFVHVEVDAIVQAIEDLDWSKEMTLVQAELKPVRGEQRRAVKRRSHCQHRIHSRVQFCITQRHLHDVAAHTERENGNRTLAAGPVKPTDSIHGLRNAALEQGMAVIAEKENLVLLLEIRVLIEMSNCLAPVKQRQDLAVAAVHHK